MKKSLLRVIVASIVVLSPMSAVFAWWVVAETTKIAAPDTMPVYNTKKFYKFDKAAATTLFAEKTASLQQITCPSEVLMKQAWLVWTNRKWTSVTYEDTDAKMNITYDMVNCNFNGYSSNTADYATLKPITLEQWLAAAKKFIETSFIKDLVWWMLGEPVIMNQYNYAYPMPIDMISSARVTSAPSNVEYIDKDEFTNVTVLFPFVIDGKKVYSNYWGRLGITVEVTERGVNSYYGQLIKLPGEIKDAKPMTSIQFINYIKRGWNNPYRGEKTTVTLWKPERIYTLVQDWRNNKSSTYIASATLFPSTMMTDVYSSLPYEMIVTDYKFANTNFTPYPVPMY